MESSAKFCRSEQIISIEFQKVQPNPLRLFLEAWSSDASSFSLQSGRSSPVTRVNYCDNFDDRWLQERRMTHLWAWLMITLKWLWLRGIIIIRNKAMMPMIDDLMIMATITLPSTLCPVKKMLEGLSRTTWKFSKLDSLVKHNLSSHCQTMPLKTLATCAIMP